MVTTKAQFGINQTSSIGLYLKRLAGCNEEARVKTLRQFRILRIASGGFTAQRIRMRPLQQTCSPILFIPRRRPWRNHQVPAKALIEWKQESVPPIMAAGLTAVIRELISCKLIAAIN
jgi:hypothetical protein